MKKLQNEIVDRIGAVVVWSAVFGVIGLVVTCLVIKGATLEIKNKLSGDEPEADNNGPVDNP